jgi:hypothetical protein
MRAVAPRTDASIGGSSSPYRRVVCRLGPGDQSGPGLELIERVMNPTDRRLRVLRTTPKGEHLVEKLAELMKKG